MSTLVSMANYEGGLLGLTLDHETHEIDTKYAFSASQASLNAMASYKNLLAIGGFAEIIKIYDTSKATEVGELVGQEGTVTALGLYSKKFVVSGHEDGTVVIWDSQSL